MTENCDPLDLLLAAFEEVEQADKSTKTLKETNLFEQESNIPTVPFNSNPTKALINSGDTDSSDEEDNRHWQERKYSENGRDIKRLLDTPNSSSTKIGSIGTDAKRVSHLSSWKDPPKLTTNNTKLNPKKPLVKPPDLGVKNDVYTDPIFGLRIINPLISSTALQERMMGRQAVNFMGLSRFLQIKTKDKDWVIAGVIVNKTAQKTSQKGNKFSLWTLSDLKNEIKTVTLFLFAGANDQLWKTALGTVVGVLNPDVLEKRNDNNEATLSVNNVQKVMIFGQSKDFGICKSIKKNGDKCTAVVNVNICEYCIYHIKQEYQKCSIRSDLQSTFGGRGLTALRNKVLGKNEVFYAGKSYMAIPTKRSKKSVQKDNNRLDALSGKATMMPKKKSNGIKKKSASRLEVPYAQRVKDLQLLEKLTGTSYLTQKTHFEGKQSSEITLEDAKSLATSVLSKLKAKQQNLPIESSERTKSISPKSSFNPDATTSNYLNLPGTSTGSSKSDIQASKKSPGTSSSFKPDAFASNDLNVPGTSSGSSKPSPAASKTTKSPITSTDSFELDATASNCLNSAGRSSGTFKPDTPASKVTDNILKSPGTSTNLNPPGRSSGSSKSETTISKVTDKILKSPGISKVDSTASNCLNPSGRSSGSSKPNTAASKAAGNILKSPETSTSSFKPDSTASNYVDLPGRSNASFKPNITPSKATKSSRTSMGSFKLDSTASNCLSPSGRSSGSSKPDTPSPKATGNILTSPGASRDSFKLDGISDFLKANTMAGSSLNREGPFSSQKYGFPKLSGFDSGLVDLNKSITPTRRDRAKQNAIKMIQKVGPIKKSDPNSVKGSGNVKKRQIGAEADSEAKRFKAMPTEFTSERFKKLMAAVSSHQDLIEAREDEEQEKYFKKLEIKENMEEKMIGTHKLACKAVRCLQCKYVSFSASDHCKSERHPLKVFDAMKRFFKCGNCQKRTVCLDVVPLTSCSNCGQSKWEKTGMMKEKLAPTHSLSIRGGEQKHLNCIVTNASLDLLVPD